MVFNNSTVDLWVLPPPAASRWFARADWYLNWQMCQGLTSEKTKPSVELFRIMEASGFQFTPTPEMKGSPLLISSVGRLPAAKCVVLEMRQSFDEWLQQALRVAHDLKAQTVRVFLPNGTTTKEAQELMKAMDSHSLQIEFSADEDAK